MEWRHWIKHVLKRINIWWNIFSIMMPIRIAMNMHKVIRLSCLPPYLDNLVSFIILWIFTYLYFWSPSLKANRLITHPTYINRNFNFYEKFSLIIYRHYYYEFFFEMFKFNSISFHVCRIFFKKFPTNEKRNARMGSLFFAYVKCFHVISIF